MNFYDDFDDSNDFDGYFDLDDGISFAQALVLHVVTDCYVITYVLKNTLGLLDTLKLMHNM